MEAETLAKPLALAVIVVLPFVFPVMVILQLALVVVALDSAQVDLLVEAIWELPTIMSALAIVPELLLLKLRITVWMLPVVIGIVVLLKDNVPFTVGSDELPPLPLQEAINIDNTTKT